MEPNIQEQQNDYRPLGRSGLGGWLILVQIGLYFSMFLLAIQLLQHSLPAFATQTWEVLTSKQSEYYHPLWGPTIIFEAVFNAASFIFCVYLLINLYKKKTIFPRLMIIFYSVSLAVGIMDYLLILQIPLTRELDDGSLLRDLMKSGVRCAIWIPYFLKSERVHNTFVK
ncbi:DUF2569 domain-containing protein [Gorillibacterium sp. sgz5001074]|uniref:DUF2569 domain-containing protein n=1 Tax=Gorillibacterium sp. sgz5001074 TaxID=3446695 RepID=UPI003F67A265